VVELVSPFHLAGDIDVENAPTLIEALVACADELPDG